MQSEQHRFDIRHRMHAIGMCCVLMLICMCGLNACDWNESPNEDATVTNEVPNASEDNRDAIVSPDTPDMPDSTVTSESTYTGVWLLNDMETTLMGKRVHYNRAFIQSYQKMTESTCGIELDEDGRCNIALVGYVDVTAWESRDDGSAVIHVPFIRQDNGEEIMTDAIMTMETLTNTLNLHIEIPAESLSQQDGAGMESSDIRCAFTRPKHSSAGTLGDYSVADSVVNAAFYDSLVLEDDDSVKERVLAEDENSQIKLLGRTHDDDSATVGYLLRVTNKTERPLMLNHFLDSVFTIHGIAVSATYTRPLPGRIISEETGEELFAPIIVYLAFPRESVGDDLSELHGNIFLTDYNWTVQSAYEISL